MRKVMVVAILLILMSACSYTTSKEGKEVKEDKKMEIVDSMTSIGAVEPNDQSFDQQKLTYSFTISNEGKVKVGVLSIKPVLSDWIEKRLIEENPSFTFNEDSIIVSGYVIFDTKGLTKEEILENEPFITGIKLTPEGGEELFIKQEVHKE